MFHIQYVYNHIKMVQILTIIRPFKVTELLYTHRHFSLGGARMYNLQSRGRLLADS